MENKLKQLALLTAVASFVGATDTQLMTYEVTIDVNSSKPSGLSWDIAGGAPDTVVIALKKYLVLTDARSDSGQLIQMINQYVDAIVLKIQNKNIPNTEELQHLIDLIEVLRSQGKDISVLYKKKLRVIIVYLETAGQTPNQLIDYLQLIINHSQVLKG